MRTTHHVAARIDHLHRIDKIARDSTTSYVFRPIATSASSNAAAAPGSYGTTQLPAPRARYERYTGTPQLARKARSHAHEYETYTVPGIIRGNWLEKHHRRCPALLVAVFDFDPRIGAAEWTTIEALMMTRLHEMRTGYAKDRAVDVQVVLVRQAEPPQPVPTTPSAIAMARAEERAIQDTINERVSSVRRKWPLDANGVMVLQAADIASGAPSIVALEVLLRDRALAHYAAHTTRLKRALARIGAAAAAAAGTPSALSFAPLRVRLLFKVAHLQEFRGRPTKALKYYSSAYAALLAIPQHVSGFAARPDGGCW